MKLPLRTLALAAGCMLFTGQLMAEPAILNALPRPPPAVASTSPANWRKAHW